MIAEARLFGNLREVGKEKGVLGAAPAITPCFLPHYANSQRTDFIK